MAKRLFELPETKGKFEISGVVFGTKKEGFSKEVLTKNKKQMQIVNYGVTYDKDCSIYETLNGMESEYVYFSKKSEEKGGKPITEKVKWADRFSFNKEGFKLIGKNIGVEKKLDSNGKEVNDKKVLVDFDAAKELASKLTDGVSVYTRGKVEFSSFKNDKNEIRRSTKLVPDQVSLCANIDFTVDDFKPKNNFNQVIVFMGIEKEKQNDKETGRAIVSAKIVTYNSIEDAEFIIEDSKLMSLFRKNLKAYTAIKVNGHISASTQTETVTEEDSWGESDEMDKVNSPTIREFIITGATPSTIDKETYSKDKLEEAIASINKAKQAETNFGSDTDNTPWGEASETDDDVDW